MKTEIFIHVGLSKTGTTFLQSEIFPRLRNCNFICRPVGNKPLIIYSKIEKNKINIISDERLSVNIINKNKSNYGTPEMRFVIADRLKAIFPYAKIIVGVRNKESWLKSRYKQYRREDGFFEIDSEEEFIKSIDREGLNFERYINHLKIIFPDVYVYRFEDLKNDTDDCVRGICDFIGAKVPNYTNRIVNPGLTNYQVRAIYLYDKIFRSKKMHYLLRSLIGLVRPYK